MPVVLSEPHLVRQFLCSWIIYCCDLLIGVHVICMCYSYQKWHYIPPSIREPSFKTFYYRSSFYELITASLLCPIKTFRQYSKCIEFKWLGMQFLVLLLDKMIRRQGNVGYSQHSSRFILTWKLASNSETLMIHLWLLIKLKRHFIWIFHVLSNFSS